ncbi:putative cytosine deaminase [Auriscalpium vulgare]|uniref:Cytosine deaminase n=1 Tax=Auriscalpium vulgare TaxID=40419 RepID=A0ACB8S7S7_9AGAM|nr:putative cytosine deaminase [Auriscalpium vulgare]
MASPSSAAFHDARGLRIAFDQARRSYEEGGIPIGSVLLDESGRQLGAGHNERVQKASPTLHAEIAALEDAGRLSGDVYKHCTLYTTLSPCSMCTGAALLYGIPRVVIGENANFTGDEDLLRSRGVEVIVANETRCIELMARFIKEKPELWNEDIGESV